MISSGAACGRVAPSDAYGHGTHVAGLIGSRFVGVAPNVRLIGLKVLDAKGQGRTSDVLRAIQFAIDNKDALGIRVVNLSLGHPVYEPAASDPLVQAVESAVRAGLVVVTSAGNFGVNPATRLPGYAGLTSPGNAPSALTVGAVQTFDTPSRADDRIAPYSSRGPSWYDGFAKPDVAAPGHGLLSIARSGQRAAQAERGARRFGTVHAVERHEHGGRRRERARRARPAGQFRPDAQRAQGRARVHVDPRLRRPRLVRRRSRRAPAGSTARAPSRSRRSSIRRSVSAPSGCAKGFPTTA